METQKVEFFSKKFEIDEIEFFLYPSVRTSDVMNIRILFDIRIRMGGKYFLQILILVKLKQKYINF